MKSGNRYVETSIYLRAERMNYCWSCHHEDPTGISLDDSEEVHVCDKCWAKIPIAWRLLVTRYFREGRGNRLAQNELF